MKNLHRLLILIIVILLIQNAVMVYMFNCTENRVNYILSEFKEAIQKEKNDFYCALEDAIKVEDKFITITRGRGKYIVRFLEEEDKNGKDSSNQ